MGQDLHDTDEVRPGAEAEDLSSAQEMVGVGHDCEVGKAPSVQEEGGADTITNTELKQVNMEVKEPATQPVAQEQHHSLSKIAFASTVGNVLEWYDFGVFAFLAPQIGAQFFPKGDRATGIMSAFIVFGGAFVIRPLGGALFGHIGDRYGRKAALQISVAMMGISTFIIGCLPTYGQIGPLAPFLLVICRLLQGLSVGGEFVGSLIFAVESSPPSRKVFFGSLCTSSAVAGTTLGSWTGLLLHSVLTDDELLQYGWRIPFWSGMIIGAFALWIRKGLGESEEFEQDKGQESERGSPLIEGFRKQPVSILLAFFIAATYGFGIWFVATFPPVLYLDLMDPPLGGSSDGRRGGDVVYHGGSEIWLMHTLCLSLAVITIPMFGLLGDKLGNRFMMAVSTLVIAIASVPCSSAMGSGVVSLSLFGQAVLTLTIACIGGNFPSYLVQVFPVNVRYSCLAVGYNGALGLFGGTAGIVGTYLFKTFNSTTSIGAYMAAVACLSCVSILIQNARHRRDEERDVMLKGGHTTADAQSVVIDMRHQNKASLAAADAQKIQALESAVSALEREREEVKAKQDALVQENRDLAGRIAALEAKVLPEPV